MAIMTITNAADSCDIYEMRTQVHHACDYVIDQLVNAENQRTAPSNSRNMGKVKRSHRVHLYEYRETTTSKFKAKKYILKLSKNISLL